MSRTLLFSLLFVAAPTSAGAAMVHDSPVESAASVENHDGSFIEASGESFGHLTIFIPASPDGGFDRTGKAVRAALLAEGLVDSVDIVYSPGAGGLIGLAQFIESRRGDGAAILVAGRTTLGAIAHNRSTVTFADAAPIARLIQPIGTVIVSADSTIRSFDDLVALLSEEAELIRWVGGSAGSFDEMLTHAIAKKYGRGEVSFIAVPGGGAPIIDQLNDSELTVAVSSYEEFAETYARGEVRILAVDASEPLNAINAPTLAEYDVQLPVSDWRGVFAAPGLSPEQTAEIQALFERLAHSDAWSEEVETHNWINSYLPTSRFEGFLAEDWAAVQGQSDSNAGADESQTQLARSILGRGYRWAFFGGLLSIAMLGALAWQRYRNTRQQHELSTSLDCALRDKEDAESKLEKALNGATNHINLEFEKWKLTAAETEIGWMLLKGLSFKEIAEIRDKSERTVRQQARSIYAKSGLGNRSDLAAHFLEDFFAS